MALVKSIVNKVGERASNTSLLDNCTIAGGEGGAGFDKVPLSKVAAKATAFASGVSEDVQEAQDEIRLLIEQLKIITDCEVLQELIRPYVKTVTDQIADAADEAEELIKKHLPVLKLPTTPWGAIKWIKKLMLGTILPMLEAYIALAKEIIELVDLLKDLLDIIQDIDDKLEECALQTFRELKQYLRDEINGAIDEALAPILCQIAQLQSQIDAAIGLPTAQLDFSSPEAFLKSTVTAMEDKRAKSNEVINEPIVETPVVSSTTFDTSDGRRITIEDGMVTNVETIPV